MSGCVSLLLCQAEKAFCCVRLRETSVVSGGERRLYVRLRDPFVVSGSERCLFYQVVRAFCCVRL